MNKTYIKRQVILRSLGIPVCEEINNCYNYLEKLINKLEKIEDKDNKKIVWCLNDHLVFEYNKCTNHMWINIIIWRKLGKYQNNNIQTIITNILSLLLKESIKVSSPLHILDK